MALAQHGYGFVHQRLAIGSAPPPGKLPFDAIVLCAREYQPSSKSFHGAAVLHVPFDDADPISREEAAKAERAGAVVANMVRTGSCVLVTCRAGRNRSGLVTGIALIELGANARGAVDRIRAARGEDALSNEYFERLLYRYDALKRQRK
jgi:protein-tyrosine phosphatase